MSPIPLKKSPRPARDRHYLAERLRVRAEMLSNGEDEISEVIDERALKARAAKSSNPPSGSNQRFALAVLDRIQPPWLRAVVVVVALLIFAALAVGGVKLSGWL